MHPADDIRGSKSALLSGKNIVLALTGSIAAVETIKLARELIRNGANVIPVMTKSATKIIHPDSLWFATGHKPIVELSGETEHVKYCGRVEDKVHLLLISPCTANTISKIAHGIDDSSVTTFATTAIGSGVPIIIVPAMHISMFDHKIVQKNIKLCEKNGIEFIKPKITKNKAKMPDISVISDYIFRKLGKNDLKNKKILVIGGATSEFVDDIRFLTNKSSGKTTLWLCKNAFYRGAQVDLWYGRMHAAPPVFASNRQEFKTIEDLFSLMYKSKNFNSYNLIFVCAALSDYKPVKCKGKIPSGKQNLNINFEKTKKFLPHLRKKAKKSKIVAFKVEDKKSKIKNNSMNILKNYNVDFVVGNTIKGFSSDKNEIWIFDNKGEIYHKKADKQVLTDAILDVCK